MPRTKLHRLTIREALLRLQQLLGLTDAEVAKRTGIARSTVTEYKNPDPRQSPTLWDLIELEHEFKEPLVTFFDRGSDPLLYRNRGIGWRLEQRAVGVREHAIRLAALGAVLGEPPTEIAEKIRRAFAREDPAARAHDAETIAQMARGGLALGMVVPELSEHAVEVEQRELSGSLASALAKISPDGVAPEVRVVHNVAHRDFLRDPVARFLIARAAHDVVRSYLDEKGGYTIGIAGGQHVDAFVRCIGPASSPFPASPRSATSYTLVPLTLEPLHDHKHSLANALAGEMYTRMVALGLRRVTAPSFAPFGYSSADGIKWREESVALVCDHYGDLDVAVFGCGDDGDEGWSAHVQLHLGLRPDVPHTTDVCLTRLDRDAQPIPLQIRGVESEYLGVGLRHIQRVARKRLALLLTSGPSKGRPLTLVVRAGCANAVVCDEAAAQQALEVLRDDAVTPARE